MSSQELALELRTINRQQRKIAKALQAAERKKTRKTINYPKAIFMLNVVLGLAFIVTNAIAKFAFLMR